MEARSSLRRDIMSTLPPSLQPQPTIPLYASWDAERTLAAVQGDRASFVVGICITLSALHSLQLTPRGRWYLTCLTAIFMAGLAMAVRHPQAHSRQRSQWAALQHTLISLCPFIIDVPTAMDPSPDPAAATLPSLVHFAFLLLFMRCYWIGSVVTSGMIQPSPVVLLGLQALVAAKASLGASASCASTFMQQPATAGRLRTFYVWLRPLVVLAEPLLLAAGVPVGTPNRRCIAVHVVCAVWGAAAVAVLVLGMQLRGYLALKWRQQRARQALGLPQHGPLEPGEWQLALLARIVQVVWARIDFKWFGVVAACMLKLCQLHALREA